MSTLCEVKGSLLETTFSGRHEVKKKDGKIYLDRQPHAFNLMIDFIKNRGKFVTEELENNIETLF